ncbi:MAG: LuxR C-terminal-related transcriptional regulator [Bacillota bacterium]
MAYTIKIPEKIKKKHETAKEVYPVFVFTGLCGIGKTSVVQELLKKEKAKVIEMTGETQDFSKINIKKTSPVFLYDDAHLIQNKEAQREIVEFIKENANCKFYILTRSDLPHWLLSFQLAGKVQVFCEADFKLNQKEIEEFFADFSLTQEEIMEIHDETEGYPLHLFMIEGYLKEVKFYSEQVLSVAKERMFHYLTEEVFQQFSLRSRRVLLSVCLFKEFDIEFIKMVSGEPDILLIIDEIQGLSNFFLQKKSGVYEISEFFQAYLQWKLNKEYKEDEIRQLYSLAGRYYELCQRTQLALACYLKSREKRKIINILVDNSEKNPAIGDYLQIEPYFLALSEEEIKTNPSLMAGMSMLKCMRANYEESTYWQKQLEEYLTTLKKSDSEYKSVKAKLIYLDIALPQSGTESLLSTFSNLFTLLTNREVSLPQFSITSLLPSILNGGKDFSLWTKNDLKIYKTMRLPCEAVLGKDGIGAFDCAICESLFEKGQDYISYLTQAMAKLTEIQQIGSREIEFYLMGLMARIQISQGNSESARETLLSVKKRFETIKDFRFMPNISAMLCKINLLQGDYESAIQWLEQDAPKDDHQIWTILRYQYLVKCEVYIQQGNYLQALCLLAQLRNYTITCDRPIDRMQTNLLMAICYFRQNNSLWKENAEEALEIAYEYKYVNPVAQYGVAVLPLLSTYESKKMPPHFAKILLATRNQASVYQRYLEPVSEVVVNLSPTELAVLRLLCQNKSNAEIGNVLNIKLPTVKTHTLNIYRKMNVGRRSEAKTEAKRLNLIDEYLAK